jgi:phosphoglycolate phosphatase
MKPALALFDFDGTLADSLPWFQQAMSRLGAEFNLRPLPPEEVEALRHADASSVLKSFDIPVWKVPRLVTAMRRLMASEQHGVQLFAGIEPFARKAHAQGLKLGIVSSNSEENVRTVLGSLAEVFTCFECGVSMMGKASKLRRASRAAKVPIGSSIYIGDELRDLDAARKVHMAFGAVTWGWNAPAAFLARQPTALFASIPEMQSYLLG